MKSLKQINPVYLFVAGLIVVLVVVGIVYGATRKKPESKNVSHPIGQVVANLDISGNGDIHVAGIMVTENSWGTITATSTIGDKSVSFVIKTDGDTVVHRGNTISSVSRLAKGDLLMIIGTLESFGDTITLMAKDIRTPGSYNYPQNVPSPQTSTSTKKVSTGKK